MLICLSCSFSVGLRLGKGGKCTWDQGVVRSVFGVTRDRVCERGVLPTCIQRRRRKYTYLELPCRIVFDERGENALDMTKVDKA